MIDRVQIRERLTPEDIIHLMNLLGATQYTDKGNYLQFKTICHNEDENDAGFNLSYYKDNHRFYCFSNCHSMDIFELVKKRWILLELKEDTHFENIAYWVMNHTKMDLDDSYKVEPSGFKNAFTKKDFAEPTQEIILPEKKATVLESFSNYHCIEWLRDGISDEAMDHYNIKYSPSRNAVIIPHYDIHGRLVGIRRRVLNPEEEKDGKYKPIFIENVSYSHPLGYNLYGLNLVKDAIIRRKKVFVAEGEKSALQAYTMYGKDNIVVAACGSRINKWQVNLLTKYCHPEEIIIAFDKGLDYDMIEGLCRKYKGYCNFSYLWDYTGNLMKDKQSPFDCGKEILEKLIKGRVKIK